MTSPSLTLRRWWRRSARYRPASMTGAIVAVTVLVYVIEVLLPGPVQTLLGYAPITTLAAPYEPWRMLTALLVHAPIHLPDDLLGITHILFNMYALVLVGRSLEGLLGAWRLLALYLVSGLGGSVAVQYAALAGILSPYTIVIGASGAVFGLFGALLVAQRRLGGDTSSIVVVIGLNLVIGFVLPGVAWEAHLGGLVVGLGTGWLMLANRGPRRAHRQAVALGAVTAALVLLAVAPFVLLNAVG